MNDEIKPFTVSIAQSQIDDLQARLSNTRWPEKETVEDWSQGSPLVNVQALCEYWQKQYDWRKCEAELNQWDNFITNIDGVDIHFIHVRSPHSNATPMIMTHGWPGSVLEFMKVIEPLTKPDEHGGNPEDAFHLVIPSIPGYGFSGKPSETGWDVEKIAEVWNKLMIRLGYTQYVAQGGDWGAVISTALAASNPPECQAIHLNMPVVAPSQESLDNLTEQEQKGMEKVAFYRDIDSGYATIQRTRPQSIGYGLVDSPAALAAWIYEKMYFWTDNNGKPEDALSTDEILDNIMLYWLTETGASSARLYWENAGKMFQDPVKIPAGLSVFPGDIFYPSKRWCDYFYNDIAYWNVLDKGGHFAAFEQPELFVKEVRNCFAALRSR